MFNVGELDDLEQLRAYARSDYHFTARDAVERIAQLGDRSPETLELLVELLTSKGETVWPAALAAIRELGPPAIQRVIERIGTPTGETDAVLFHRATSLGEHLLPLARILITDGDLARARMAQRVMQGQMHLLPIDEALDLYLVVGDRERATATSVPHLMTRVWPRLATAEGRAAVAARWTARELEAWIEERIEPRGVVASILLPLLLVAPVDTEERIRQLISSVKDRWTAIAGMLVIDPVRCGAILCSDPALAVWAEREAVQQLRRARPHVFAIAMAGSLAVVDALVRSARLEHPKFVELVRDLQSPQLHAALLAADVPAHNQQTVANLLAAYDA